MHRLFNRYCQLMIPGLGTWPSYASADTSRFWQGWQSRTPLTTRFAVYFCFMAMHGYCLFFSLLGRSQNESLAASETSLLYLMRQAFTMVKTIAFLAYFSDPAVHALASTVDETVPV